MTGPADAGHAPGAQALHPRVFWGEGMAAFAVCLGRLPQPGFLASNAPSDVFSTSNDLHVRWPYTPPISTEMINRHARRNWPDKQLIENSVGPQGPSAYARIDLSIAGIVPSGDPFPASVANKKLAEQPIHKRHWRMRHLIPRSRWSPLPPCLPRPMRWPPSGDRR
jgi:hypothetical protein